MAQNTKPFRYFDIILGIFVAVLLISNTTSTKILRFGPFTFDGGTLLFPIAYIFGDILTEVYGYKRSRKVIWTGFFCLMLMVAFYGLVGYLPAAADWPYQQEYQHLLGFVPRIALASLVAYLAGEFSNSYVLAKMKVAMKGKALWARTIGSTIIGEALDTSIFVMIAFYGALPGPLLWAVAVSNYIFKVGIEVLFTPATYAAVRFLKRAEGVDHFDTATNFNPFSR